MCRATDSGPGTFNPIEGDTSSTLVTALLDGTTAGTPVQIWQCDPGEVDDACLNPTLVTLSVPVSSALRTRVALLLDQMVQATIDDTAVAGAGGRNCCRSHRCRSTRS